MSWSFSFAYVVSLFFDTAAFLFRVFCIIRSVSTVIVDAPTPANADEEEEEEENDVGDVDDDVDDGKNEESSHRKPRMVG